MRTQLKIKNRKILDVFASIAFPSREASIINKLQFLPLSMHFSTTTGRYSPFLHIGTCLPPPSRIRALLRRSMISADFRRSYSAFNIRHRAMNGWPGGFVRVYLRWSSTSWHFPVKYHDFLGIADFSLPSHAPRFYVVTLADGSARSHLVAHGRGSDPSHTGWLERFSNEPHSNATSAGAYRTDSFYVGAHGHSIRLEGLDTANSAARAASPSPNPAFQKS
jgi:hypothetical protein